MAAKTISPALPGRYHVYHAEAHVLSGNLKHPIDQPIEHHAHVILKNRRADHIAQTLEETSLDGLISFKSGHTRVSGTQLQNKKDLWGNDHSGWVTLSTSVIEGLNVFEVITADRVVAQVSTEHADLKGRDPDHVPKVTFLGTRFENLRVGGYPVEVDLDLSICGNRPEGDKGYLQDTGFLDRVKNQLDGSVQGEIPQNLSEKYQAKLTYINDLRKRAEECAQVNERAQVEGNGYSKLECSLVKKIGPIPIPGVRIFGNMIFIPDFGTVSLAEVEVGTEESHDAFLAAETGSPGTPSNYFTLHMLNMHLGCIGGGSIKAGGVKSNGNTQP